MEEFDKSRNVMTCENCGRVVSRINRVCPFCAASLKENVNTGHKTVIPVHDDDDDEDETPDEIDQHTPPANAEVNGNHIPNLVLCPDCGSHVSIYTTSCPRCGKPLVPMKAEQEEEEQIPQRSGIRTVGLFAAVVLGILAAIWIASEVFHINIIGNVIQMKK